MKYDFLEQIKNMQKEMDNLLDNYFESKNKLPMLSKNTNFREPITDYIEKKDKVIAVLEIPGIDKKDVNININDDFLEINAKKDIEEKKENEYIKTSKSFYKSLEIPKNIDSEKIDANYKDGLLKITMFKKEISQTKQIEVK